MHIPLGDTATLREAPALHAALRDALENHSEVEIDAAQLVAADLSVIQLIEAARVHATQAGKALRLTAPANAPLTNILRRAGFLTAPSTADTAFWFHGDAPR